MYQVLKLQLLKLQDPKADSIEGSFVARGDEDGDIFYIGREDASGFSLEAFKKMVFPTAE